MGGRQFPKRRHKSPSSRPATILVADVQIADPSAREGALRWLGSKLWRWDVTAGGSLLLYGNGTSALYGDDYLRATIFFVVAICWFGSKVLLNEATKSPRKSGIRALVTVLILVMIAGSLGWILSRKRVHTAGGGQIFAPSSSPLVSQAVSQNPPPEIAPKPEPSARVTKSSKPVLGADEGQTLKIVNNYTFGNWHTNSREKQRRGNQTQ
jgi:hypothetical protein